MQGTIPRRRYVWGLAGMLVVAALGMSYTSWQAAGYVVHTAALFWGFVVGVLAQLVDGALGMAYGVTASTFLLATGATPVVAAASVHVAKFFASGASALSHWRMGNVDRQMFWRLLLPGLVGAVVGVYVITTLSTDILRPLVNAYLLVMGLWIVLRAFWQVKLNTTTPIVVHTVGFVGAFVNAIGGGGWGPVVTTTMLGAGSEARYVIGTVNTVEFFVTFVSGAALIWIVHVSAWEAITGLIFGGMVMAPIAAWVVGRIPKQWLMVFVGVLISAISAWSLWMAM